MQAKGEFEVKLNPMESYEKGRNGVNFGRMSIDKTFTGDLEAISKGEMLSAMTSVQGSAGYVALEQVTGVLNGKQGSFVFQHFGTITGGNEFLKLEVVPDSGFGELKGITGSMTIQIKDGKHFYEFDYHVG